MTDYFDYENDVPGEIPDFCREYIPFSDEEALRYTRECTFPDPEMFPGDCVSGAAFVPPAAYGNASSGNVFSGNSRDGNCPAGASAYGRPGQDDNLSRVYLNVPYAEKDTAKGLGARWDSSRRKWYVTDGTDLAPFQKWL
ncbi:DUF5710 domain-containing protein [Succinimonas sp.]|uniref:DUF5710 domain-containing protein n=1 Tax=Succinimonas sp. TaxID=1936151 RepID=UPI00386DF29F